MATVLPAVTRGASDVSLAPPIVMKVQSSHLYPGLRIVAENAPSSGTLVAKEAVILFSDGSTSEARFDGRDDDLHLYVREYTTLSGTHIPAKRWPVLSAEKTANGLELHLGKAWSGETVGADVDT